MVSSCQWPFSSFLLASSLLNSRFYFSHSGTLQSSAVVSLIRHNKHRQKSEPVRTATKNRVWPLQKIGKFCNYQNLKDAYSFLSGNKILCSFYFDSYSSLGHLISRTLPINVIGYTNNSRVPVATCCTRVFVSVISSCFV